MLRLILLVTFSLYGIGEAKNFMKSKEPKDTTIPSVFQAVRNCYEPIGNLGANLTIEFPTNDRQLNDTCKKAGTFNGCTSQVENRCNAKLGPAMTAVQSIVRDICRNGSDTQKNFMNSTKCFNLNVQQTRKCYFKYLSNNTNDAKSLCCSVYKTKKCVNDLPDQCPKNATKLRDNLQNTYNLYADELCGKYYKQCNSAYTVLPSNIWISTVIAVLISSFRH